MSLHDHNPGGALIFAGEATGTVFRLQSLELHNNDDDDKPDVPESDSVKGNWIKVLDMQTESMQFMYAPGEMIQELQRLDAEEGDAFEVTRCVKSGSSQTDPYEVNVEALEEPQERL